MGELGVGAGSQVIAYAQGNGAYGARLWWLLRFLGFHNVAVLDGGMAAWRAAGLPLVNEVRTPVPAELPVTIDAASALSSERVDTRVSAPGWRGSIPAACIHSEAGRPSPRAASCS